MEAQVGAERTKSWMCADCRPCYKWIGMRGPYLNQTQTATFDRTYKPPREH